VATLMVEVLTKRGDAPVAATRAAVHALAGVTDEVHALATQHPIPTSFV